MVFKEIIKTFRDLTFMNEHINGFYTGLESEHNDAMIEYPALRVSFPYNSISANDDDVLSFTFDITLTVNQINVDTGMSEYELNINQFNADDILNEIDEDLTSENELREKAVSILSQWIQGLRMIEETHPYFIVGNGWKINSLERYANDMVTGCRVALTISVANDYKCQSIDNVNNLIWNPDNNLLMGMGGYFQNNCPKLPSTCQDIIDYTDNLNFRACVLNDYDFSDATQQDYIDLTLTQKNDLKDILCPIPDHYSTLFNGVNKSIKNDFTAPQTQFNHNTPFSCSIWCNVNNNAGLQIILGRRSGASTGFLFYFYQNTLIVYFRGFAIMQKAISVSHVPNQTWKHLSFTYDGSNSYTGINIYVDGNLITQTSGSGTATNFLVSTPYTIGQSNGSFFNGYLTQNRLFDKVLTSTEIQDEYNGGLMLPNGSTVNQSNLVFSWLGGKNAIFDSLNQGYIYPEESSILNPSSIGLNQIPQDITTYIP